MLLAAGRASAALGGAAGAIDREAEALRGSHRVQRGANYTTHELITPTGLTVREYEASGQIFAVTWRGRRAPDLRLLLGDWFGRFNEEAGRRRRGHHSMSLSTPDFSASSVRSQRGFEGRAIVAALKPAGVAGSELK